MCQAVFREKRKTLIRVSDTWWLVEFTEKLSEKENMDEVIEYLAAMSGMDCLLISTQVWNLMAGSSPLGPMETKLSHAVVLCVGGPPRLIEPPSCLQVLCTFQRSSELTPAAHCPVDVL